MPSRVAYGLDDRPRTGPLPESLQNFPPAGLVTGGLAALVLNLVLPERSKGTP